MAYNVLSISEQEFPIDISKRVLALILVKFSLRGARFRFWNHCVRLFQQATDSKFAKITELKVKMMLFDLLLCQWETPDLKFAER
jgi:hypothetical protein